MILAAGLGTRLKPLTDFVPKPLVPLGDKPMIMHVVERLRNAACGPIVVNAYHHLPALARFCETEGLRLSEEADLLGTAGGVAHAASLLGEGDVLVHNGDVLVDVDLGAVVAAHHEPRPSMPDATLVVVAGPKQHGNVGTDERGRVVRLRTETFAPGEVRGGEFTGVSVVSARVRAALPTKGCIIGDVLMPRLRALGEVRVTYADAFIDIGSLEGYLRANAEWLARHGLDSFVDSTAYINARVVVDGSVVGAGGGVDGEGRLTRCVVWPNAIGVAPATDTVFTPHGVTLRR